MEKLIQMGVDGFRFDAAKHIPSGNSSIPSMLREKDYLIRLYNESGAREKGLFCYGGADSIFLIDFEEVMDGDPDVCKEYTRDGFHVSNFPLTFALVSAFGWEGDIRKAMDPHFHQLFGSVSIAGAKTV